ncbi:MAG: PGPGW domain-containing protein [Deltaproteobacteria bacterium]|nr:PGPGW domain-containing protein [Deltaproteobacteria bacterium]
MAHKIINFCRTLHRRENLIAARRLVIIVFGLTLFLIGIAMILLPGPAIVVIPLSLAVLGTEFLWARKLLKRFQHETDRLKKFSRSFFKKKDEKTSQANP